MPEGLHDLRLGVQELNGRRVGVVAGGEGTGVGGRKLPEGTERKLCKDALFFDMVMKEKCLRLCI